MIFDIISIFLRYFKRFLDTLLDMYQNWLIEKAVYDPEQAEKFLPKELKRHLVIGKKNSLTQKVPSIV